jgi:hypothetical protein
MAWKNHVKLMWIVNGQRHVAFVNAERVVEGEFPARVR